MVAEFSKVHGVHHGAFGADVGDQHVDDVVAVLSHGIPHRGQNLVHLWEMDGRTVTTCGKLLMGGTGINLIIGK